MYKCSFDGEEVDLDNPETYNYFSQDVKTLRDKMFTEIGYYYCYVNYWHKDIFDRPDFGLPQKIRVDALIKNFTDNERQNYDNVLWYQEQIFLFQDETENMC